MKLSALSVLFLLFSVSLSASQLEVQLIKKIDEVRQSSIYFKSGYALVPKELGPYPDFIRKYKYVNISNGDILSTIERKYNYLFRFSPNGKFLYSFRAETYNFWSEFSVDETGLVYNHRRKGLGQSNFWGNNIVLTQYSGQPLKIYDKSKKFLKEIPMEVRGKGLTSAGDFSFLGETDNFVFVNENNELYLSSTGIIAENVSQFKLSKNGLRAAVIQDLNAESLVHNSFNLLVLDLSKGGQEMSSTNFSVGRPSLDHARVTMSPDMKKYFITVDGHSYYLNIDNKGAKYYGGGQWAVFSHDSKRFAYSSRSKRNERKVHIVDAQTNQDLRVFDGYSVPKKFSHDSKYLHVQGWTPSHYSEYRIYDVSNGDLKFSYTPPTKGLRTHNVSADDKLVFSYQNWDKNSQIQLEIFELREVIK